MRVVRAFMAFNTGCYDVE